MMIISEYAMIKIELNEREIEIESGTTITSLKICYYPDADLIFHNGSTAILNDIIIDGDRVIMIKKDKIPTATELESLITARHTSAVYHKLKSASVAIIGLGGLGSNAAISLVRMGIGTIKLIDYDYVEPSNINRQYYFLDQLGIPKTEALESTIKRINPYVQIDTAQLKIQSDNILSVVKGYDVIIEAVDDALTKKMIISSLLNFSTGSYIIGASGIAGLYDTSIFTYKTVGSRVIIVGDFQNEVKKGRSLISSRVAVAANIQANLAARYIVGDLADD